LIQTRERERQGKVNADQIVIGILRIISALISSVFLAIHKVFLRKTAFIRTQILSQSALADLISVYQGQKSSEKSGIFRKKSLTSGRLSLILLGRSEDSRWVRP